MTTKWKFYDVSVPETYTFEVNPTSGGSVSYKKGVGYQSHIGPASALVRYETQDAPQELAWSGVILDSTEHYAFVDWWDKRKIIVITDDLGRSYNAYIVEYLPDRERKDSHAWYHTYSMRALVI